MQYYLQPDYYHHLCCRYHKVLPTVPSSFYQMFFQLSELFRNFVLKPWFNLQKYIILILLCLGISHLVFTTQFPLSLQVIIDWFIVSSIPELGDTDWNKFSSKKSRQRYSNFCKCPIKWMIMPSWDHGSPQCPTLVTLSNVCLFAKPPTTVLPSIHS